VWGGGRIKETFCLGSGFGVWGFGCRMRGVGFQYERARVESSRTHAHASTRARENTRTRAHAHASTRAREHTRTRAHVHASTRARSQCALDICMSAYYITWCMIAHRCMRCMSAHNSVTLAHSHAVNCNWEHALSKLQLRAHMHDLSACHTSTCARWSACHTSTHTRSGCVSNEHTRTLWMCVAIAHTHDLSACHKSTHARSECVSHQHTRTLWRSVEQARKRSST